LNDPLLGIFSSNLYVWSPILNHSILISPLNFILENGGHLIYLNGMTYDMLFFFNKQK
jgi:hypothetical protein